MAQFNSLKEGITSLEKETEKDYKGFTKKVRENYAKGKPLTEGIDTKKFDKTKRAMSKIAKK